MLDEQPAGGAVPPFLAHPDPEKRRQLLGLGEIGFADLGKRRAGQRHDSLISLVRNGMVERDRKIAFAEQRVERRVRPKRAKALRVVPDIASQLAVEVIADQQVDNAAFGLSLHCELAILVFEKRAHHRRQHQPFRQQMHDRQRVVMR